LALFLAEDLLDGKGAYRVHGGGFGGTTQNYVPLALVDSFQSRMEAVFGEGCCHSLSIRPVGGTEIIGSINP
ncbi:MAG: galactokinase, partial [Oscillospiraceae bacterium]